MKTSKKQKIDKFTQNSNSEIYVENFRTDKKYKH